MRSLTVRPVCERTARLLPPLVLAATLPFHSALAQQPSPPGYQVERTQTIQNAPAGSVGRKTTDRETRVGNADETRGNQFKWTMTIGGFMRRCPGADGIVLGEFEYTLTYDETTVAGGEQRQSHKVRRLGAQLKGHVDDNGNLDSIELDGTYSTVDIDPGEAPRSTTAPVHTSFGVTLGDPDLNALQRIVEETRQLAVAAIPLVMGPISLEAQKAWSELNQCVEFIFDPATDTRSLGPGASAQVRVELHTKEGGLPVPWKTDAEPWMSIGTVSPRPASTEGGPSATLTYTASSQPRRGHGIRIETRSRAGFAGTRWRIIEELKFEGTFTQVDKTVGSLSVLSADTVQTVTGRLVWVPDRERQHAPTFGDVASVFYVLSDGEITVETSTGTANSVGGACESQGSKTFALGSLPAGVLQYLLLEIAADGRYNLVLAIPDYPQTTWEIEAVCRIRGARTTRQKIPAARPAVQIGRQQGRLNEDQSFVGDMAPIRRGPLEITGQWSFKKLDPQ